MKNLINIWKNKNKILEGIKNSIFKTEHVEVIAKERNKICKKCPHIDNTDSTCLLPRTEPCCKLCGCSLHLKQRSLSSSCDDGRWGAVLSEEEEDLLNQSLNK